MLGRVAALLVGLIALCASPALACWGSPDPHGIIRRSDVIVRARAVEMVSSPARSVLESGRTEVHFILLEQLKGKERLLDLRIPGYLDQKPSFTARPGPYHLARSDARGSDCHAETYQRNGEYLLFLKDDGDGTQTPYWAPLSPTNEQVAGADDPWVAWVRQALDAAGPERPSLSGKGRQSGRGIWLVGRYF